MTPYISKLGVHSVGSKQTGYGEFLKTINSAGRRLSLVKCRDSFGAAFEAKKLWPDLLTIGAMTAWDDSGYDEVQAFNKIMLVAGKNPHITHWEFLNERNGDWNLQADLYLKLMPMLERSGLKLCAFNCATGTPPYPYEDGGVAYNAVASVARRASQGGHLIGLHGYNTDRQHQLLRYRDLHGYLVAHGAACDFALTEFGPDEGWFQGVPLFMDWCVDIDQELMKDHYLAGAALWTLGGAGWQGVNFEKALHDFTDSDQVYLDEYIATINSIIVPPEPVRTMVTLTPPIGEAVLIDVPTGWTVKVEAQ